MTNYGLPLSANIQRNAVQPGRSQRGCNERTK